MSPTDEPNVVWRPLPGSQTLALNCPASVIVYHGTRGPGKTDSQLMFFRRYVGQGYGKFWRGIIFDREYKNLDDLVSKSQRWFPAFKDNVRFISSKSDYKWVWPTGEELLFRAISKIKDYWGYHGQEYPFIGWNELTKYPTDDLFELMASCNRSSFLPEEYPIYLDKKAHDKGSRIIVPAGTKNAIKSTLPEIRLVTFITTNPFGVGHNWVKKRFIDVSKAGEIKKTSVEVFNPRTQQREPVVKTQVHIFGSYRENRYLSPEYIATLESMTDKNKRKAWLYGSWDVVSGGMFDDLWEPDVHILEPFKIPLGWRIDRSFDYGSSKPFSVGWWAESNGSDYTDSHGNVHSTVKGDLFRINEWYGVGDKANTGLRLVATDITIGIIERELEWGIYKRCQPGPADNSIWNVDNGNSIGADMKKKVYVNNVKYSGVQWLRSDKSPGSRIAGWEKIRQYLANASEKNKVNFSESSLMIRTKPGLFTFSTCSHFIELFPVLPRDEKEPDDVDTDAEDHIGDEVRYRVMSSNSGVSSGRTSGWQ